MVRVKYCNSYNILFSDKVLFFPFQLKYELLLL